MFGLTLKLGLLLRVELKVGAAALDVAALFGTLLLYAGLLEKQLHGRRPPLGHALRGRCAPLLYVNGLTWDGSCCASVVVARGAS